MLESFTFCPLESDPFADYYLAAGISSQTISSVSVNKFYSTHGNGIVTSSVSYIPSDQETLARGVEQTKYGVSIDITSAQYDTFFSQLPNLCLLTWRNQKSSTIDRLYRTGHFASWNPVVVKGTAEMAV